MKTKEIVLASILLALGLVLHFITPAILGGVKPDFLLATMFIAILFQPRLRNVLMIGFVAGILAALTTSFPGGQLPSILDKIGSALFVLGFIKLMNNNMGTLKTGVLGFLATLVSGVIFLGSAFIIVGLPTTFSALFMIVVLPTAAANTVFTIVLYQVSQVILKNSKSSSFELA